MTEKKSNTTLCPLAWNHFSVSLDTSMRICCNTHNGGRIKSETSERFALADINSLDHYYNTPHLKDIRKQMMNGERPEHCLNCFKIEDHGGQSLRQIYLNRYIGEESFRSQLRDTEDDGTIKPNVTYMDFSLTNKCNLKCVMCNPHSSTILKADFDQLGWDFDQEFYKNTAEGWADEDTLMKTIELCIPTVQEMLFTGGEPLISTLHVKILEKVVSLGRASDIILRYHSNCTNVPERLFKLWPSFKQIEVHASVDAFGGLNDYIRYGSDFRIIEENIKKIADIENVRLEVHTCFQVPTLLNLPDLYHWLSNLHPKIPALPYHIWVNHPSWLEADILPQALKQLVRARLESFFLSFNNSSYHQAWNSDRKKQVFALLNRMDDRPHNPGSWHEFKHKTSQLESLRSNRLKDFVPELFL